MPEAVLASFGLEEELGSSLVISARNLPANHQSKRLLETFLFLNERIYICVMKTS